MEKKYQYTGDYDADGITATTILKGFLEEQDIEVSYYIPNRIKEGYGVKKNILEEFKNIGYSLVITVDTGITAVEEAKFARSIGLDMIITDHHEMQEELPEAIAVVDLKRKDIEIDLSLKIDNNNMTALDILKEEVINKFSKLGMSNENMENKILAMWSLVAGLVSIINMTSKNYIENWEDKIEEIIKASFITYYEDN